jgi:hypothetical protein
LTFLARVGTRGGPTVEDTPTTRAFFDDRCRRYLCKCHGVRRLNLNDHSPGAPLDTRRAPGGSVVTIMRILGDPEMPAKVELVLRFRPNGQMFAAISRAPVDDTESS